MDPRVSLCASLLPHQYKGVTWCLQREKDGCILADDMGLGKTVTTCALMVRNVLPTLIVAPLALLYQWEKEIAKHTHGLNVTVYQGVRRHGLLSKFSVSDVVITNPESVVSDYKKHMLGIYKGFGRLIVDEAHILRNHKSKLHKAVASLSSDREPFCKVFLTGTPVCNSSSDLISMVVLLNLDPYSNPDFWKRSDITKHMLHLQDIRKNYILRRTKAEVLGSTLPTKTIRTVTLELNSSEVYTKEYQRLRNKQIKPVIAKILRLRQCVNQISLIHDAMNADPIIMREYNNKLPSEISAKLEYIRATVAATCATDKVVIFSQWTTMLVHIERFLTGVTCEIYHGKLTREEKESAVERFNNDANIKVLLMSLRSGSCGLNLCVANHAIITEPYFNISEENQAIDRIYRIGQTKDVHVHKLIVPSTVENWMQQLQEYKGAIAETIMNDDSVEKVEAQNIVKGEAFREYVQS